MVVAFKGCMGVECRYIQRQPCKGKHLPVAFLSSLMHQTFFSKPVLSSGGESNVSCRSMADGRVKVARLPQPKRARYTVSESKCY